MTYTSILAPIRGAPAIQKPPPAVKELAVEPIPVVSKPAAKAASKPAKPKSTGIVINEPAYPPSSKDEVPYKRPATSKLDDEVVSERIQALERMTATTSAVAKSAAAIIDKQEAVAKELDAKARNLRDQMEHASTLLVAFTDMLEARSKQFEKQLSGVSEGAKALKKTSLQLTDCMAPVSTRAMKLEKQFGDAFGAIAACVARFDAHVEDSTSSRRSKEPESPRKEHEPEDEQPPKEASPSLASRSTAAREPADAHPAITMIPVIKTGSKRERPDASGVTEPPRQRRKADLYSSSDEDD